MVGVFGMYISCPCSFAWLMLYALNSCLAKLPEKQSSKIPWFGKKLHHIFLNIKYKSWIRCCLSVLVLWQKTSHATTTCQCFVSRVVFFLLKLMKMTTHMGEFEGLPPVRQSSCCCMRGLSKLVCNCPHSISLEAVASFYFRASVFTWGFLKCSVRGIMGLI